jgi:hypothetical protein
MPYVLVRHKVQDYGKWKSIYDEHGSARKMGGSKGARVPNAMSAASRSCTH